MVEFFASNPILSAIANLTAIIGAAVMVWKLLGITWRFTSNVYRTNVLVAIGRIRRQNYVISIKCAADFPYFFAEIIHRAVNILLILITFIIATARPIKTEAQFQISKPLFFSSPNYENYLTRAMIADRILSVLVVIGFIFLAFRLIGILRLAINVQRLRFRWRARKLGFGAQAWRIFQA